LSKFGVSDRCSDVQRLFSVIGNDGGDIIYKKVKISFKKIAELVRSPEDVCYSLQWSFMGSNSTLNNAN
jgi:hypothetical protein